MIDTIYYSLIMNPSMLGKEVNSYLGLEPEIVFPNFVRGELVKYVEQYNLHNKQNINLLAYETDSDYAITWGLTDKDFLLYVGGEGEWFGDAKISISLSELIKENHR